MQFLSGLTAREHVLVFSAVGLAIVVGLYFGVFRPVELAYASAERSAVAAKASHQRVLDLVAQGSNSTIQASSAASLGEQSLRGVISSQAKASGVVINRIQPAGDTALTVWLDPASSSAVATWLVALERTYGVSPSKALMQKPAQGDTGLISSQFTFNNVAVR